MSNDHRVSPVVMLFFGILIGIDFMMLGFSVNNLAYMFGQMVGAILFGYLLNWIVHLIFRRKKHPFSHNAALVIASFFLLSTIAGDLLVTMQVP